MLDKLKSSDASNTTSSSAAATTGAGRNCPDLRRRGREDDTEVERIGRVTGSCWITEASDDAGDLKAELADPLLWFGVMVSPHLRAAQADFKECALYSY